jgi:transcription antitermination factor NusG
MNLLKELDVIVTGSKVNLSGLSLEELKNVITEANYLIRKKEYEAKIERKEKATKELKVGDIVSVTGDKFKGEIWEVVKLNPKKVKCKRENGETWNIPYAHIILE